MMSLEGALMFIAEDGAPIIIGLYLLFVLDKKIDKLIDEVKKK
jgi:hypothetical protein